MHAVADEPMRLWVLDAYADGRLTHERTYDPELEIGRQETNHCLPDGRRRGVKSHLTVL